MTHNIYVTINSGNKNPQNNEGIRSIDLALEMATLHQITKYTEWNGVSFPTL